MKDKSTLVTAVVIVGVLLVGAFFTYKSTKTTVVSEGELTNTFSAVTKTLSLSDLEGNPVSLDQYEGKVVVANSWASWCPFCVAELGDFSELTKLYDPADVVVLAVNRAEQPAQVEAYMKTAGTFDGVTFLLDESDSFYALIGGFGMPETVFYDREGEVVLHKRGFMDLEEMKRHTESALSVGE